ncbi:hypothetical protein [Streptomyces griseus]|uniref:hypothetical protein n=1 Tax=Streptomyces griseus TaxID=1911 RepID=UPI0004C52CA0|nr:hypothetical protein [Streptomyces griseus]
MTTPAAGSPDNPVTTTVETVPPVGCFWFLDPDGTLCLAPGCTARIQDPDAQCLCDTLAARLDHLTEKLRALQARQETADQWWHALSDVVNEHPDGQTILTATHARRHR